MNLFPIDVDMILHELVENPVQFLTELNFSGSNNIVTAEVRDEQGKEGERKPVIAVKLQDVLDAVRGLRTLEVLRLNNCGLDDESLLTNPDGETPGMQKLKDAQKNERYADQPLEILDDNDIRFSGDWFEQVGEHLRVMDIRGNNFKELALRVRLTANATKADQLVSLCGITSIIPGDVDKDVKKKEDAAKGKDQELFTFDHENNPRMDVKAKQRRIDLDVQCHYDDHKKQMIVAYASLIDEKECQEEELRRVRLSLMHIPKAHKQGVHVHPQHVKSCLGTVPDADLRLLAKSDRRSFANKEQGGLPWDRRKMRGDAYLIHNPETNRKTGKPPALRKECEEAEARRRKLFKRREDPEWNRAELTKDLEEKESAYKRANEEYEAEKNAPIVHANPVHDLDEDADNDDGTDADPENPERIEELERAMQRAKTERDEAKKAAGLPHWLWALLGDKNTRHTVLGDEYRREVSGATRVTKDCEIEVLEEAETIRQLLFVTGSKIDDSDESVRYKEFDYITLEAQKMTDRHIAEARSSRGEMRLDKDLPYDEYEWYKDAWKERRGQMNLATGFESETPGNEAVHLSDSSSYASNEECTEQELIRKTLGLDFGDLAGRSEAAPPKLRDLIEEGELPNQFKNGKWASQAELEKTEDTKTRAVERNAEGVSSRVKTWLVDAKIESYDGGFVAGKFDTSKTNKNARVEYDNGDTYVGPMKNSMRNGKKGRMTFAIGGSYDGMWSDDKRDGEGNQTDADRGEYNGEWLNDKRHTHSKKATGKQTYANGDTYVGKWINDKRHGKDGTQTYANGDTYEGKWEDDMRHGTGTQTDANGDKYEGKWEHDKRHGTGKQTFADGDWYEGDWADDEFGKKGKLKNNITWKLPTDMLGRVKKGEPGQYFKEFDVGEGKMKKLECDRQGNQLGAE